MSSNNIVSSSLDAPQQQVGYHAHEVIDAAKGSMQFLAGLALPEVCTVAFPAIFVNIWNLLVEALFKTKDFSKYAIGLPRGHGKTIVLKLLILYIILFTNKKFILVVCASKDLAENILADVIDTLESENIRKVFGNWNDHKETDRIDKKKFYFRGRHIILAGVGSGSTLRGLNIKYARPDVMIMDDMQTKDQAESEVQSLALMRWFTGTLMKAKSPSGCTFLYVGNMYPDVKIGGSSSELHTCILKNLQTNPNWTSWVVGAILQDGSALWPELQSMEQLLEELENDILMGCPEVFYSEVLNDPSCGSGRHFDISKLPAYPIEEDDFLIGRFIIIDPSLGRKKSDAQVVIEGEVYNGKPVVTAIHIRQESAPKLVKFVIGLAVSKGIPLVCAESVAYQATLLQWFEEYARQMGLQGVNFRPVSPKGVQKNSRILGMFKELVAGEVTIHPNCLAQVLSQISAFDPMRQNNTDDIIDTIAYVTPAIQEYPEELMLPYTEMLGNAEDGVVAEDSCVF